MKLGDLLVRVTQFENFSQNGQILATFSYKNRIFSQWLRYRFFLKKPSYGVEIWSRRTSIWFMDAEIWIKNIKNTPKMRVIHNLWPPNIFIKNQALSLLYPYGILTSWKKLEKKNNEWYLRYLKTDQLTDGPTDGPTNGRTRVITEDPLGRTRGPKLGTFQKKVKNSKINYMYFQILYRGTKYWPK